ncbi:HNH endonuclease [Demequina globuliformis]|uniref:HNH endonuclease n=1 Tax=Demequina globuliformis TaxID=676202 RepID=UPI00078143F8|nr:HNH endonuclease signature motif containing protein [Demequina globuliformis]
MTTRRRSSANQSAATRARYAKRRKNRLARVDNDLAAQQWQALVDAWGGCAYCGATDVALQKDCVQPISRGGRYTLDNVVPACASCNASKHNSEVTGWLRRKKLDERTFLERHAVIQRRLRETQGAADSPDAP